MVISKFFSYFSKRIFSKISNEEQSILLKSIPVIATFDMDDYSDIQFTNNIQLILETFPKDEGNRAFRRVKNRSEIKGPEDEFFLIAFKSSKHKTVWILYSYVNVYLIAVLVGDEKIYVLDAKDFKFPQQLLVGLERVDVNCGLSYMQLPSRHGIAYSHTLICHSVFILSLGYTEKRSKEWKQGIVRAIGFTSESLRFPLMKDVIKRTSDLNAYATETPSAEIFQMMNNWDKISRSVRSGRPFKLGTRTYLHCCLCKIVSLLNHNDGTELKKAENSLNKCAPVSCNNGTEKEDLENSLNKGFLVPHDRICPSFLSRVSGSISDMSGVLLKPNTNIYSHGMSSMVFSQLTHNDGFEMENSLNGKGFLVPHHRISPKRANDNNFLSRVPSSICDISCISLKPVTNIYSHGMSSLVLSPLTRIDGFEMENSLNGMVSLERSICLTGAIAGTKEPQHSNFPRRANDSNVLSRVLSFISNGRGKPSKLISNIDSHGISRAAFSPLTHNYGTEMENSWNRMGSLVPQNDICPRGAIGGSLVPQHIICPRRANAVVHYTPPCFPARAYRCPRPLFSNFLISASRMMIFFMHHR